MWDHVFQPYVKYRHRLEGIKLNILKLSSKSAESLNFQKALQDKLQVMSENTPLNFTRQIGQPSVTEVEAGISLHSRPEFNS